MKRFFLVLVSFAVIINAYPQSSINYYQDGAMGAANLRAIRDLGSNSFVHAFGIRSEGVKGTPNLFNNFVSSYLLVDEQNKYVEFDSDIDLLRNMLVFRDPATGEIMEISSDNVKEVIYKINNGQFTFKTTKGTRFSKKMRENKFYQVVREGSYPIILITFKKLLKTDYEPTFNSGQRSDEYKTDRRYYLRDSRGVYRQVVLNTVNYDCLLHPRQLDRKTMARIYPDKKELIYSEFRNSPDSVSLERVISILDKF